MKPGRRALGVAESYRGTDDGTVDVTGGTEDGAGDASSGAGDGIDGWEEGPTWSTLAGAVVRADRTVDDLVVGTCTVGGTDATEAIGECWARLDRPDVRYVLVSGVALAWYNVLDLEALHAATDRPVLAVTYEASDGLADAIAEAFEGEAREARLERYEALPERRRLATPTGHGDGGPGGDAALYVRSVGIDESTADEVLAAYTHGRRPEPLRVAGVAARRIDAFRRREATRSDDRDRRD